MTRKNDQRGEMPPHRSHEAAKPAPEPKPNRDTKDDGRGRDARRTGSDSNSS